MDSGCEVVIVDVNVATTNGINGAHEEEVPAAAVAAEMKTRSKVAVGDAGDDEAGAKPKVRLTRAAPKSADDKEVSDGEKAEKKGAGDAAEAGLRPKEPAPTPAPDAGASAKAASGGTAAGAVAAPSAAKKKAPERDDDSGINSRASSVSNDELGTPARMRTRSSRAPEPTASTSGAGRAAARLPISIYEFDAASFDDDLPLAASTSKGRAPAPKRKAVYVEEMDDEEDEGAEQPPPKRRLASAGAGLLASLLYPLRKLRNGIAAVRPLAAPSSAASFEQGDDEDEAAPATSEQTAPASGEETAHMSEPVASGDQPGVRARVCSVM